MRLCACDVFVCLAQAVARKPAAVQNKENARPTHTTTSSSASSASAMNKKTRPSTVTATATASATGKTQRKSILAPAPASEQAAADAGIEALDAQIKALLDAHNQKLVRSNVTYVPKLHSVKDVQMVGGALCQSCGLLMDVH